MNLLSTQGIVLRTVKYSETSVIVTIYTKQIGTQGYIVGGVRSSKKSNNVKSNYFTPAAILDLVVYNNQLKNLNRIKEIKWDYLYQHLYYDIYRNTIATFIVELLQKTLKQPDTNIGLYQFLHQALILLDTTQSNKIIANLPIYFMCQLAYHLGLKILDNYSLEDSIFNIQEGLFVSVQPAHPYFVKNQLAYHIAQFIQVGEIKELENFTLNSEMRIQLIEVMENFFKFHIADFSNIYSLRILQQILR